MVGSMERTVLFASSLRPAGSSREKSFLARSHALLGGNPLRTRTAYTEKSMQEATDSSFWCVTRDCFFARSTTTSMGRQKYKSGMAIQRMRLPLLGGVRISFALNL